MNRSIEQELQALNYQLMDVVKKLGHLDTSTDRVANEIDNARAKATFIAYDDFDMALYSNARNMYHVISETYNMLREKWKYADLTNVSANELIDELYENFNELQRELGEELN